MLDRLFAKEPCDRYASAAHLVHAIAEMTLE
jgi:hypothetical protein